MRVLPAIFSHARDVSSDIAGIQIGFVEGRIQKLDQRSVPAHEAFVHCIHCHACALCRRRLPREPTSSARSNRSGIPRCSATRAACHRRSRRGDTTRRPSRSPRCSPRSRILSASQRSAKEGSPCSARKHGELLEHFTQEEGQPDAFAFAVPAHQIHAVVPVTGPDERQAVLAESESSVDGADTVLVQAGHFVGPLGQIVVGVVLCVDRAAFQEVNRFIQHAGVAGAQNVAARCQWQPQVVIRTMGAHAPARRWMPPVLDIPFAELTARTQEQVLAHQSRLGVDQRHHVLQLIAEAEGAPRLVVSAARPDTARQGLVQEPAVGQHVEGFVWCFYLHRAESVLPILTHRFERPARGSWPTKATYKVARSLGISSYTEPEDDLALLAIGELEADLDGGAGIQSRPYLPEQPRPSHGGGTSERAIAPEEFSAVAGEGPSRIVHIEERCPVAEVRVVRISRKQRTAVRIDFCGHVHARLRPQISQHPLYVAGCGEPAAPARLVSHLQHRELDRCVHGYVNPQLGTNAA